MALALRPPPQRQLPGRVGTAAAGSVIGGASSLFGIGGGTLTVPWLSWCNVPILGAVGTASACGLPTAPIGMVANIHGGWGRAGSARGGTGRGSGRDSGQGR